MILQQVSLLSSIKLNQHSGAVFDYIFLFLLASAFLDSSRIVRSLNVFIVTGPIQAPIFACSPFLTYKINLVVDPSEIFFSASSKKAWKINVICRKFNMAAPGLRSQATPISLRLKYN